MRILAQFLGRIYLFGIIYFESVFQCGLGENTDEIPYSDHRFLPEQVTESRLQTETLEDDARRKLPPYHMHKCNSTFFFFD